MTTLVVKDTSDTLEYMKVPQRKNHKSMSPAELLSKAFEKKDKKADKKQGVKEGSKKDIAKDKRK